MLQWNKRRDSECHDCQCGPWLLCIYRLPGIVAFCLQITKPGQNMRQRLTTDRLEQAKNEAVKVVRTLAELEWLRAEEVLEALKGV